MTGVLLSRRHRATGRSGCDVCGTWRKENTTAPFVFTTTTSTGPLRERVAVCTGCLREAVKVATEGRKVRR